MNIVLVNKYFHPDLSATSQLATDLARHLAARGHRVDVVTSRQLYGDPAALLAAAERDGAAQVRRLWSSRYGRRHLGGRILDYLTFHLAVLFHLLRQLERGTTVICCTDPPLASVTVALACRLRGAHLVNWLQDLYPEVATRLQVTRESSLAARLLLRWRDWSLRKAACNVAVGEVMAALLRQRLPAARVQTIHNWSDSAAIRPLPAADNPLRREWGLEGRFVVGYSGNLGKAHEHATLLDAARRLQDQANVVFLMIGGGAGMDALAHEAAALGLHNLVFKPYQSRERLKFSLTLADVHLVILQPALEGCIVPSKFYGAAAAGKPVVFIGAQDGEIARLLREYDAGVQTLPGDGAALAQCILMLAADAGRYRALARHARLLIDQHYNMARSLQQWTDLLEALPAEP